MAENSPMGKSQKLVWGATRNMQLPMFSGISETGFHPKSFKIKRKKFLINK
jgi:hypothetical protein